MSFEPKILNIPCSCVYTMRDLIVAPICQVCGGSGELVDWVFDLDGNLQTVTGLNKLQQDILKIMLSYTGSNTLYPEYGSNVDKTIGQKNLLSHTEVKLQQDIYNALMYLKNQQQELQTKFNSLSAEEALETIESVSVIATTPTSFNVSVTFTTKASASSTVSTTIGSPVGN